MRDERGRLLTMYHGTNADKLFTVFDTYGGKFGLFGRGSYFTDNPDIALSYTGKGKGGSPRVYEVYLNITNPIDMDAAFDPALWRDQPSDVRRAIRGARTNEDMFRSLKRYCEDEEMIRWEAEDFITDTILSAGFDGITHIGGGRYGSKDGPRHRVYIAMDPEQVKNADNRTPTANPDIRFSLDEQRAEDEAYLSLAKDPKRNRGKLQEMVNAAAERAGYDSPDLYHGTRAFGFTEFDLAKMDDGTSIFLTTNPTVAGTYTSADAENTNLETLYRNPKSPADRGMFNDRSMEREVGRTSLNVGRRLVNAFARANVAGNLSSALNQTAQLPMIAGELGAKYVAEAIGDIAKKGEVKGDFAARSDFLTEKHGIDYLTSTKGGQITEKLFWPLERMDYLISSIAVRGKYRKELAEGKSEKDALRAADRWGRDIMGSRSKGTAPLTFQSKSLLSQMVNLFQVEALNSWEHVTQDLFGEGLREAEAKLGRNEAARRLAGVIVGTLLGAFLLNRVDEELYGGTPAPFDVLGLLTGFLASGNGLSTNEQLGVWVDDVWQKMTGERLFGTDEDAGSDEFNLGAAAEDTLYNISNDVPYVRNVSGVLGLGDETLPMPDIAGTFKGVGGTISKQASGDFDGPGDFWSEVGRQLMGLAGDTLPGGRQAEKSAQGIETLARGGSYQGFGDSKQLQYPVDIDPYTALRVALFGKNALPESRTYWAAGGKALSAKETRAFEDLVDSGMSRKDAYATLLKLKKMTAGLTADLDKDGEPISGSKKEKVLRAIHSLPLSRKQKDLLYLGEGYSEKGLEDAPWH